MKKILFTIISVLVVLVTILFVMWRNTSKENASLCEQNANLTAQIEQINQSLVEKEKSIQAQNKKYHEIINSIKYNDCENLPVSKELVEAAKELQQ